LSSSHGTPPPSTVSHRLFSTRNSSPTDRLREAVPVGLGLGFIGFCALRKAFWIAFVSLLQVQGILSGCHCCPLG